MDGKRSAWQQLFSEFEGREYSPTRTTEQKQQDLAEFLQEDFFLTNNEERNLQYSQRKHARRRGFDPGSFNQWLNGSRLPDGDNLFHLALVYGPLVYDIVGVPPSGFDPRLRLVTEYFTGADEEGKRKALRVLQELSEGRPLPKNLLNEV